MTTVLPVSEALTFVERGFPWKSFPSGWFQLGWSADFTADEVVSRKFFGTELAVYRMADGRLAVLDAFCLHMGANLAQGGTVEGSCLRCPYHGWLWDSDGRNVEIPYGDRPSINARTRSWAVEERNGLAYVWHDARGEPPSWPIPHFDEETGSDYWDPSGWATHAEPMRMPPQFASENFPDFAHMQYVHRWKEIPSPTSWVFEGAHLQTAYPGIVATPQGDVTVDTVNDAYGIGLNVNKVLGTFRNTTLGAFTPIDDRTSMGFITIWLPKRDPAATEPQGLERAMAKANIAELFGPSSDRRIWENMHYRTHPLHAGYEHTHTREFRAWSRQFYPQG